MAKMKKIHFDNITLDSNQSRSPEKQWERDEKDSQLTDSIQKYGIFQSIVVRPTSETDYESEEDYVIVAGSRRYNAAIQAGESEAPCIILKGYTDEEIRDISASENLLRKELDSYDEIRSIGRRFVDKAQNLVGKNETVECPECGQECEGRQGLKTHFKKSHERSDSLSHLYLSEGEIYKEIADEWFDRENAYKTVERASKAWRLPETVRKPLLLTEEERKESEKSLFKNYSIDDEFTLRSSQGERLVNSISSPLYKLSQLLDEDGKSLLENLSELSLNGRVMDNKNKILERIEEIESPAEESQKEKGELESDESEESEELQEDGEKQKEEIDSGGDVQVEEEESGQRETETEEKSDNRVVELSYELEGEYIDLLEEATGEVGTNPNELAKRVMEDYLDGGEWQ